MWIADGWKDYELLDCGGGEKLERWGQQLLVRPDPQAIWEHAPEQCRLAAGQRPLQPAPPPAAASGTSASHAPSGGRSPTEICTFNVKPMNFKHTGLFPEQAANWDFAMEQIRNAGRPIQRAEPLCLHRRGHCGLRRSRAPACAMWTPPRAWWPWARENAKASGLERGAHPLDRGRLRQVRGAGDPPGHGATTPSSWTRPPTAGAPAARCGSWRTTSTPS